MEKFISTIKLKLCKTCDVWYRESDKHLSTLEHFTKLYGFPPIVKTESAAKCRLQTYFLKNGLNYLDYVGFFEHCKPFVIDKLEEKVTECKAIKCNFILKAIYVKDGIQKDRKELTFKTRNEPVFLSTDLQLFCEDFYRKLIKEESDFLTRGSGWSLSKIIGLEIRINKYTPLKGKKHIPLPADIASKHAVINVVNDDPNCFKYAILSKFVQGGNAHRVSKYNNPELENKYNWDVKIGRAHV